MGKFAAYILFLIFLGMLQVSFLAVWPYPVNSVNLLLSLVVFLAIIVNYERGLWWTLGSGLFLELYTGTLFGITTLAMLLTVIAVNFLFNNFFTNRSFYSLMILGFVATIVYNAAVALATLAAAIVGADVELITTSLWSQFFWQPLFNLIILAIIFVTYYFSTGKLRNIFIFPTMYETKWKR